MMIRTDILRLTTRQLSGTHRLGLILFIIILAALPIILAQGFIVAEQTQPQNHLSLDKAFVGMLNDFQMPFLYPIIILILASLALREEISNGTITYLWTKPIPRASIVLSKFVATYLISVAFVVPSIAITTQMLKTNSDLVLGLVLVGLLVTLAYGGLFLALSVLLIRSILVGFFYILIWESLLSRVSPLASQLSIRHYAQGFSQNVQGLSSELSLETSIIVLLAISIAALAFAIWRFEKMEFPGEQE